MRSWMFAAVLVAACGKGDKPPPPQGVGGIAQETGPAHAGASHGGDPGGGAGPSEAEQIFMNQCSRCHGMDGTGKTEIAGALNPKPRDYTDKAWQASVTDAQIREIILKGGQAVGKSPMMPANPTLESKPAVVDELVKIIRNFGRR